MLFSILAINTDASVRLACYSHLEALAVLLLAVGPLALAPCDVDGVRWFLVISIFFLLALLFADIQDLSLERMRIPISYAQSLLSNQFFVFFYILAIDTSACLVAEPASCKALAVHFEAFWLGALAGHRERGRFLPQQRQLGFYSQQRLLLIQGFFTQAPPPF